MKRLMIGTVAALAVALAGAPVAQADADRDFLDGVSAIGYVGDPDRLVKTGHVVCSLLDSGVSDATVAAEIAIHHRNPRVRPGTGGYYTTLFTRYAEVAYCPWNLDGEGEI